LHTILQAANNIVHPFATAGDVMLASRFVQCFIMVSKPARGHNGAGFFVCRCRYLAERESASEWREASLRSDSDIVAVRSWLRTSRKRTRPSSSMGVTKVRQ